MNTADPVDQLMEEFSQFKADHTRALREIETRAARPDFRFGAGAAAGKSPEVKAFESYLRTGDSALLRKAMTVGGAAGAEGGYTVPQDLERSIYEMARNASPMLGLVRAVPASSASHEIVVNLQGTVSAWAAETGARAASTAPTFAKVTPPSGDVWANPQITQQLLDDSGFDLTSWLSREIGLSFGIAIDTAIINGSGTNQPKGILNYTLAATGDASRAYGTIEKMHSGVSGDFDADDLISLEAKLKPQYRQNASWVLASATWAKIRSFKDSATGAYLIGPLTGATPPSLLGHPVFLDENVPAVGAGAHAVIFGDFSAAFTLTNIRGVRVLLDPYTAKPYVHFYSTQRVGGAVVDTAAVKVLTLAV